jgi:putative peptidoglycan lipid II flippase
MFPYLLLVGLAALANGVLNTHGRFFAAAIGPALLNLGMIGGVLLLARRVQPPILALAIGVLAGGVAQLAAQLPSLRRCGFLVGPSRELRHPAVARVARLIPPAAVGLAAVQVTVFVNTLLASLLPAGSISFLYYADRVMEFPLGVFGIALASAALPAMARQAAARDDAAVAATLQFALRLSCYVAVPATVGLLLLRVPITRVLFERGRFGPADTMGLVAFAAARIAAQVFYALGEPGTAVRMGALSVGANVVAAVALMQPAGHVGLALASSVGAWVNLAALMIAARRRFGPFGERAVVTSALRTLIASVPLAIWCVVATWAWPAAGRTGDAVTLLIVVAAGAGIFWVASVVLAVPERTALRQMLPRRRRR